MEGNLTLLSSKMGCQLDTSATAILKEKKSLSITYSKFPTLAY